MLADKIIQQVPSSIRRPLRTAYEYSKKGSLRMMLSQFVQPGELVFDIGAHTGYYAECFLDLGAKVICVEPQPYCIQKLKHKFENTPSITIVEKGVAEQKGESILYIDSKNSATATFSEKFMRQGPFRNRHWECQVNVPVIALDDLIREFGKPVFCKIDVEGFEPRVLQGLSTSIQAISFEYCIDLLDDTIYCLNKLEQLGEIQMNYAPTFDFTRLALKTWTDNKQELLAKISNSAIEYSGDIFVKYIRDRG